MFPDWLFSPGTVFPTEERKVGLRLFDDKLMWFVWSYVNGSSSSSLLGAPPPPPANLCGLSRWPSARVIGGEREETWSPGCPQQIKPSWSAALITCCCPCCWCGRGGGLAHLIKVTLRLILEPTEKCSPGWRDEAIQNGNIHPPVPFQLLSVSQLPPPPPPEKTTKLSGCFSFDPAETALMAPSSLLWSLNPKNYWEWTGLNWFSFEEICVVSLTIIIWLNAQSIFFSLIKECEVDSEF